jgi:hypothetical protein
VSTDGAPFEMRNRSARAADPLAQASYEELAEHWFALAEQAEWLEQRYGPALSASRSDTKAVVLQQQQVQPKKQEDG